MVAQVSPIRMGTIFRQHGDEFEITHIDGNSVSYSTRKGGRRHTIDANDLQALFAKGKAEAVYISWSARKGVDRERVLLSKNDLDAVSEIRRWLEPVVRKQGWQWKKECIEEQLAEMAQERECQAPSFSTMARWRQKALKNGSINVNQRTLLPAHWKKGPTTLFSDKAWKVIDELIATFYLVKEPPTIADAWSRAKGSVALDDPRRSFFPNLTLPSLRTIQRRIEGMDQFVILRAHHGTRYAAKAMKAAGESRSRRFEAGVVQADGHLMDLMIVPPENEPERWSLGTLRPYLTVIMDLASRAILAAYVSLAPFSACTILTALKKSVIPNGLLPKGAAKVLHIDNGSDYISDALKRTMFNFGGEVEYCAPRDPDGKAAIERFIGKLAKFTHSLPGTTRASPLQRGDYDSEGMACLTLEQAQALVDKFVLIDLSRVHAGLGRRPISVWRELNAGYPRYTYSAEEADHAARDPEPRKSSKGRVNGCRMTWFSHALKDWEVGQIRKKGSRDVTVLIDEEDLSYVYVETKDQNRDTFKADNTNPAFKKRISRFEYDKLRALATAKNIADINVLSEDEIDKLRFEMWTSCLEAALENRKQVRGFLRLPRFSHQTDRVGETAPAAGLQMPGPNDPEASILVKPGLPSDTAELGFRASPQDMASTGSEHGAASKSLFDGFAPTPRLKRLKLGVLS